MARVIQESPANLLLGSFGLVSLGFLFGVEFLEPFRPRLGTGPDACNIGIFAAGVSGGRGPFTLAIFEASRVLFLVTFLLCLFSCPLVRSGSSVSCHRYSLPALTSTAAATTSTAPITSAAAAATAFARSLRARFIYGYGSAFEIRSIEFRDRVRRFLV